MRKTKDEKELTIWMDKEGFYFYCGEYLFCEGCNQILDDQFFYIRHWVSKKEHHYYCLCNECLKAKVHKKLPSIFMTITGIIIVKKLTMESELAIFSNPSELTVIKDNYGEVSTFDFERLEGENDTSQLKLSGTQSLEGAKIGMDIQEAIAGKDDILLDNEVNKLLEDAKNSVPMIEEDKKKQLENNKI